MDLQIPYAIAKKITDHAQANYPHEVCGLVVGKNNLISNASPIPNISPTPQKHYQMDPQEQLKALKQIDRDKLDWIGVYHSHPNSHPIPSPTDIKEATEPKLIHLIISLKQTKPQLKAWQITDHQVIPINLYFDTENLTNTAHEPLSNTQKLAIILTSILSVIVMLAIAFTLLPPAPVITPVP